MRVAYFGTRGSIPAAGPRTVRFGGNTPCVHIRAGQADLVVDGGTGLRFLGENLLRREFGRGAGRLHLFFSHVHWDHIQGFPFFGPVWVEGNRLDLSGPGSPAGTLRQVLERQQAAPTFPAPLSRAQATLHFHELADGADLTIGAEAGNGTVRLRTRRLNHPGGVLAMRFDHEGKSVVYASDTEHGQEIDSGLVELARGADLLIYDAMFTPEEYAGGRYAGWGHSTWEEGVRVARAAGVRNLHLFHHAPEHDDESVARIEEQARSVFPGALAAFEGLEFEV